MKIQQGLTPLEFLEELKQHTCHDCDGHGEVMQGMYMDKEIVPCLCDNGFVE